jgi:hypothetical protein
LTSKSIDVGRSNLRLTVTAQFAIPQIVGENEHDIGFGRAAR